MKFGTNVLFRFLRTSVKLYVSNFYEIRYKYISQIFMKFGTIVIYKFLWNSVKVYFSKLCGISVSFLKKSPVLKCAKKSPPVIAIFLDRSWWNSVYGIPHNSVDPLWVSCSFGLPQATFYRDKKLKICRYFLSSCFHFNKLQ